jgi:hypothetical protein
LKIAIWGIELKITTRSAYPTIQKLIQNSIVFATFGFTLSPVLKATFFVTLDTIELEI